MMKPAARTLTGLGMVLCLSAVTITSARAEGNDLESRVNRIESQTLVELLTRLDRLQNEVQSLRGQLEEQTHAMDGLQQRQKDIYMEQDGRLRKLELGGAATPTDAGDASNADAPPPTDDAATPPPPETTPEAAYQQSIDLLKKSQYPQAIRGFRDFIGRYPDHALASNAQYWIGDANYVSRDYPAALTEFRKVIDRYPTSSKVPDALLKIGFVHYLQSNWDKARSTLSQVKSRYPDSSAARLADQRLIKMKQEGH